MRITGWEFATQVKLIHDFVDGTFPFTELDSLPLFSGVGVPCCNVKTNITTWSVHMLLHCMALCSGRDRFSAKRPFFFLPQ